MTRNALAERLLATLLRDHPSWDRFVSLYRATDDREAEPGSIALSVPAPKHPDHRLEIVQRGNTVEVAYDCGRPGLRAERQFVSDGGEIDAFVDAVSQFVSRICAAEIVVAVEPVGRLVHALRRDHVSELAWFREATDDAAANRRSAVYAW